MKGYKSLFAALMLLPLCFSACQSYDADNTKFDNSVYLNVSKTNQVQMTIFSNNLSSIEKPIQATLCFPEAKDVTVELSVDPTMVDVYNTRYSTSWKILDQKYYKLTKLSTTIPAGKTTSEIINLQLVDLMGQGDEQVGALPIDQTFLVPVRISNSSLSIMSGSQVAYYVVKRSSAITVAAQLTNNWIEFPSLDKYSPSSKAWNELRAVTYEALIYIDEFSKIDPQGIPINISSVMGIEDYMLMRIGDTNFEREQIQVEGSGVGFGKFPGRDKTKIIQSGRWYHIATTYDQETRIVRIYVNGKLQSEGSELGAAALDKKNFIHLAKRSLYNLWLTETDPNKKQMYEGEDYKYNTMVESRQFFISYSYNDKRPLNGKIAEARVWSVARSAEQIWDNMYRIENPADDATLLGYWKFNDGSGNTVKDYSRYGNDGVANSDIVWPDGVEIPEINKE